MLLPQNVRSQTCFAIWFPGYDWKILDSNMVSPRVHLILKSNSLQRSPRCALAWACSTRTTYPFVGTWPDLQMMADISNFHHLGEASTLPKVANSDSLGTLNQVSNTINFIGVLQMWLHVHWAEASTSTFQILSQQTWAALPHADGVNLSTEKSFEKTPMPCHWMNVMSFSEDWRLALLRFLFKWIDQD